MGLAFRRPRPTHQNRTKFHKTSVSRLVAQRRPPRLVLRSEVPTATFRRKVWGVRRSKTAGGSLTF
jgi:hypothetical protein